MREKNSEAPSIIELASLFLISSAVISHEIVLTRLFSITQWHHFAYMVISIALLGFGASGTVMSLFRDFVLAKFRHVYAVSAALYAAAIVLSFIVTQRIPFDPFLIVWDRRQWFYLVGYCATLFVPFLLAALCIGTMFVRYTREVNRVYFANMVGSGCGGVEILLLMYRVPPESLLLVVSAAAVFAAVLFLYPGRKLAAFTVALAFLVPTGYLYTHGGLKLHVSQFKTLSGLMDLPDARVVARRWSPLGTIDVVSSPAIREAPGMSLSCTDETPPQMALVVDADSLSAVTNFGGDLSRLRYLDCLTSSAAYHAVRSGDEREPVALIVGAGGGADILAARYSGMKHIDALELDPNVVDLMEGELRDFSCNVYDWTGVNVVNGEARAFFDSARSLYDVIQISLLDSFSASAAGVLALNESYLYTVEALRSYIRHLTPDGILSITRWLNMPPRDNIKLFATAVEALKGFPGLEPRQHIVQLRGWKTCTTLIKRAPFTSAEIEAIVDFCTARSFDLCYFPGIRPDMVNRFNVFERPYLYEAAIALLGPEREQFYRSNLFNVVPATDDKPYYFHFFKLSALPELRRMLSTQWVPFVEWGYVILFATLIIAVPLSVILIVLPLAWLRRPGPGRGRFASVLLYFFSIGAAYMFLEIVFIQKLARIMPHPVFALGTALTLFLLGSGLGGLASSRISIRFRRPVWVAVGCVAASLALYVVAIDVLTVETHVVWPAGRRVLACCITFCLAFFMGIPFPTALRRLATASPELVPWAWGINGCASVIGPVGATCLSMSLGFRSVMGIAAALYLLAALTLAKQEINTSDKPSAMHGDPLERMSKFGQRACRNG